MDSNLNDKNNGDYTTYIYANFFFTTIGIIFYLVSCLSFELYFKAPNLIKSEIFTYILFHSFEHIVGIILPQTSSPIFLYCFNIVEFFLILFFPYEIFFKLIDQYIFSLYVIKLILSILFFRYINIKMGLILEYIKDKKVTSSSIPDIYLPYIKANYYYSNFNKIDKMFCFTFAFVIIYYVNNILNLFFDFKILYKYLKFCFQEIIYLCIVTSCLFYFYCLNKDLFINKKIVKEEASNLNKFKVIDIDINQEEDENILENKIKINNKNNKDGNEGDEKDKLKKGHKNLIKNNEESEILKN